MQGLCLLSKHTPLIVTWKAWVFWALAIGLSQVFLAARNEDENRGSTVCLELWLAACRVKVRKQVSQLAAEAHIYDVSTLGMRSSSTGGSDVPGQCGCFG